MVIVCTVYVQSNWAHNIHAEPYDRVDTVATRLILIHVIATGTAFPPPVQHLIIVLLVHWTKVGFIGVIFSKENGQVTRKACS